MNCRTLASIAGLIAFGFAMPGRSDNSSSSTTPPFHFSGKEIFPIDQEIGLLHHADLNDDGRRDMVVANNARSKIVLLYNQGSSEPKPRTEKESSSQSQLNELPPDARFRIDSIASEKRIASLVVADLNSDGLPDLAYYGEPKELIVQYNEGDENWSVPERWSISDGQLTANGLIEGDLNDDGRRDLLLLAEGHIYLLTQNEKHLLGEPERIPFSGQIKAMQVLDLNDDDRLDLLMVDWNSDHPVRLRLQDSAGNLGPEFHFPLPPIRSFWADDLNKDGTPEIITIARNSGRVQIAHFKRQEPAPLSDPLQEGQFAIMPLNPVSAESERGLLWEDLDGDAYQDLLVAEPESGQITFYRHQDSGRFSLPISFPTLTDLRQLAAADWDEDKQNEIFFLSRGEQEVGVSQLDDHGRIPFPDILPTDGRPLALSAGKIRPEAPPALAILVRDDSNQRTLEIRTPDGTAHRQPLSEDFRSNPSEMAIHDADQDGLNDILFLSQYQKIKVLRQTEEKDFQEINAAPPGGSLSDPWMSRGDIDGNGHKELLLAKDNFIRALVLTQTSNQTEGAGQNWNLTVKEQINGASSDARIVGASLFTPADAKTPHLFLLDAQANALTLCARNEAGIWKVIRNLELPVGGLSRLRSVGMGSPDPNALAFVGQNQVAWMHFSGKKWQYKSFDGYETPIQDGHLTDLISGDLNHDGTKDLIFIEGKQHYIDMVSFVDGGLKPGNRWKVYEKRSFRGSGGQQLPEPREAVVADFTDDQKNDLAIIVHDRILLYPQD